ncbi:hypothetical protein T11_9235 [Trichinella zimbabwensis]|uniref:Uncharacterized protein n=1 Tax=Trichinella zimbabwensis TaxID=268475 RepID=A0A0V1G0K8_9BILA|nr:hypothetical protein T11_9235 [Trichinella zimbabwensis]
MKILPRETKPSKIMLSSLLSKLKDQHYQKLLLSLFYISL